MTKIRVYIYVCVNIPVPWISMDDIDDSEPIYELVYSAYSDHSQRIHETAMVYLPIHLSEWWQLKHFLCSPKHLGKMNPI